QLEVSCSFSELSHKHMLSPIQNLLRVNPRLNSIVFGFRNNTFTNQISFTKFSAILKKLPLKTLEFQTKDGFMSSKKDFSLLCETIPETIENLDFMPKYESGI